MTGTIAGIFLGCTILAVVFIVIGWLLHRYRTVLRWRSGLAELARCVVCGRRITRCLHAQAASGWEHLDDSTHYHFDGAGLPTVPVDHR